MQGGAEAQKGKATGSRPWRKHTRLTCGPAASTAASCLSHSLAPSVERRWLIPMASSFSTGSYRVAPEHGSWEGLKSMKNKCLDRSPPPLAAPPPPRAHRSLPKCQGAAGQPPSWGVLIHLPCPDCPLVADREFLVPSASCPEISEGPECWQEGIKSLLSHGAKGTLPPLLRDNTLQLC